jgi:hypothetical protein
MELSDDFVLGASQSPLHLNDADGHRRVVLAMVQQAQRSIHLYSPNLDPAVFDDAAVEDALTRFLLRSKNCQLLILVQDTSLAVRNGHALVRLAQKLSSRVRIKVPSEDQRDYSGAFFVADGMGYIRQPVATRYAAEAGFKAPFEARKLLQYFQEVWDRADADPQLRRLFL